MPKLRALVTGGAESIGPGCRLVTISPMGVRGRRLLSHPVRRNSILDRPHGEANRLTLAIYRGGRCGHVAVDAHLSPGRRRSLSVCPNSPHGTTNPITVSGLAIRRPLTGWPARSSGCNAERIADWRASGGSWCEMSPSPSPNNSTRQAVATPSCRTTGEIVMTRPTAVF